MAIYKIFRSSEWAAFQARGAFAGSPADLADGFIHLSTAGQLAGTLDKHFAGVRGLVIAEVRLDADPALRWEAARAGDLFPHLYRPLALADLTEKAAG
ncbi:MAG: DUF952 domain-containing protein [Sandaracinobacteroides sp.]